MMQLVALVTPTVAGRQVHTHHRTAHDVFVGISAAAGQCNQFIHWCTEQHFVILRMLDVAGDGDDARHQRLAECDRAPDTVGGGDVEALHTLFGGTHAGGDFDAGEHAYQLFGAAAGIQRGHGDHFHVLMLVVQHRLLHGGDGFRFVVLDADQHFFRIQQFAQHFRAAQDVGGTFAHQHVVAGDVRLALGAVEHQRLDLVLVRIRLHVAGEYRAAQSDHARLTQQMAQIGVRSLFVVHAAVRDPFILAVRDEGDAQIGQAGMVGDQLHVDGADRAGGGSMHCAGKTSFRPADDLPFEHTLADLHHGFGAVAHMLMQAG